MAYFYCNSANTFYDFLRQDNVYDLLLFIILFILSQQDRKKRTLAQNCDVSVK